MILNYVFPGENARVVSLPEVRNWDNRMTLGWLYQMIKQNPEINFFWTVPTTDIWEDDGPDEVAVKLYLESREVWTNGKKDFDQRFPTVQKFIDRFYPDGDYIPVGQPDL